MMNINSSSRKPSKFWRRFGLGLFLVITTITTLLFVKYLESQQPLLTGANPNVIETIVTKSDLDNHTVKEDQSRYFSMPSLGITKARIIAVGRDSRSNEIGTPSNIFDVGWFNESASPGQSNTNLAILLDGHNGGPTRDGVFYQLGNAKIGSQFTIQLGDGNVFNYAITNNYSVKLDDFTDKDMQQILTRIDNQETVTIITCTGQWLPDRQTYDQRLIVRAVRQL